MDIYKLVIGVGATFVARGDAYHVNELQTLIEKAILHKGFSAVEVFTTCFTHFGRKNKIKGSSKLLELLKDLNITKAQADKLSEE